MYHVLVLGFNAMQRTEPAPFMLAAHSARPLILEREEHHPRLLAQAMQLRAIQHGTASSPFQGMRVFTLKQDAGLVVVAENKSNQMFRVMLDCSNSFNMVSARGALITTDGLPPGYRQTIQVLGQAENSGYSYSMNMQYQASSMMQGMFGRGFGMGGPEEVHDPPLERDGPMIFEPLPC